MKTAIIASFVSLFTMSISYGADAKKNGQNEFSKETREKMALVHEKMAACLRSDKPMTDCRGEMRKNCQEFMGKDGCPMMGQMGDMMGGKGMMDNGGMMGGEQKK